MKRLYYATFENGFGEVVKTVIRKTDKNSKIKTLYDDAVLFFADEHFKFKDSCFFDAFVVIFNVHKTGVGALNLTVKNILEKRDIKIVLPKDTGTVKLTIKKENENVVLDAKLKTAFEVMVKKITKKGISYFAKDELVLLSKKDGENLFMKRIETADKFLPLITKYGLRPETAYLLNVLSEPVPNEVVVDAISNSGVIPFVRCNSFAKANVIACSKEKEENEKLKRISKKLKSNGFSVLNYDFLDDNFPIKFIDKIVTDLTELGFGKIETMHDFYDKVFELKIKSVVAIMPKNYDINRFISQKYDILTEIKADKFNAYKLKIKA